MSKKTTKKPSVKVDDMSAKKDPKGGDLAVTKVTDKASTTIYQNLASTTTTSK